MGEERCKERWEGGKYSWIQHKRVGWAGGGAIGWDESVGNVGARWRRSWYQASHSHDPTQGHSTKSRRTFAKDAIDESDKFKPRHNISQLIYCLLSSLCLDSHECSFKSFLCFLTKYFFQKFSVPHLIRTLQHCYYNSVLVARQSFSCGPDYQLNKITFLSNHFSLLFGSLNIPVHCAPISCAS